MIYAGLFLSAFTSATVLPGSSEAVLLALLTMGHGDPAALLVAAIAGNVMGSFATWGLGRFCAGLRDRSWFPVGPDAYDRAVGWFRRWGVWSLLLSWVPVAGDGITLVAGLLRVHLLTFLLLITISKLARYGVLFAAFAWWDS
jgi:membrane protein YqaA with SNARE-associated domain